MPTFSIISCTWNSRPFISDCIRSVESQVGVELEHIFVDGGSTDGTLLEIEATKSKYTCLNNVRGGISHAMNSGILAARNDVIVHLHGDDYFLKNDVLIRVAELFQSSKAEWVSGRIVSDLNGDLVDPDWKLPKFSRKNLLTGNFLSHPATFIRREVFERVGGFDIGLKYAMDYDLWLRISSVTDPLITNERFTAFRRHSGSASTANAYAAFQEDHMVRLKHLRSAGYSTSIHNMRYWWRSWKRFGQIPREISVPA